MPALEQAMRRALARKNATAAEAAEEGIFFADAEQLARMFSGFDVNIDELRAVAMWQAYHTIQRQRATIPETLAGAWLDGILLGLYLAREED